MPLELTEIETQPVIILRGDKCESKCVCVVYGSMEVGRRALMEDWEEFRGGVLYVAVP